MPPEQLAQRLLVVRRLDADVTWWLRPSEFAVTQRASRLFLMLMLVQAQS